MNKARFEERRGSRSRRRTRTTARRPIHLLLVGLVVMGLGSCIMSAMKGSPQQALASAELKSNSEAQPKRDPSTADRMTSKKARANKENLANQRAQANEYSQAAQGSPTIQSIRVGFAGDFKLGFWTPIEIQLQAGKKKSTVSLTVELRDGDGLLSQFTTDPSTPLELSPDQPTTAKLEVKFGRPTGQVVVRAVSAGRVLAKRSFSYGDSSSDTFRKALPADDELFLLVGPEIGFAKAIDNGRLSRAQGRTSHVARLENSAALPTHWLAYDGINTLIFAASERTVFESLLRNPPQAEALRNWIHQGGRLVLFLGNQAEAFLAAGSPLAEWVPGQLAQFQEVRDIRDFEAYCETEHPVRRDHLKSLWKVPQIVEVNGLVESSCLGAKGRVPLLVRRPVGFGKILFVALDMDRPPMKNWLGRSRFYRRLLGRKIASNETTSQNNDQRFRTLGYHDLSGQLHAALDVFPSVQVIPFGVVLVLILLYIAIIGPGDYFFLKRIVGRLEWTWLSFSILVVVCGGVAYSIAHYRKSDLTRINQAELIDFDLETHQLRGTLWCNIYNPHSTTHDLSIDPRVLSRKPNEGTIARLAWLGVPGRGLGGMQSQANQPGPSSSYRFSSQQTHLESVPFASWSAKAFSGQWDGSWDTNLHVDLQESLDQMLEGSLQNDLGVDLVHCRLYYKRWHYKLPDLRHTASLKIDRKLKPRSLRGQLTASPYLPSDTDVGPILDRIMFHELAGGKAITRVSNHFLSRLDLSDHLKLGRAILIAEIDPKAKNPAWGNETPNSTKSNIKGIMPTVASQILLEGKPLSRQQTNQQTIYRFVLPVRNNEVKNSESLSKDPLP